MEKTRLGFHLKNILLITLFLSAARAAAAEPPVNEGIFAPSRLKTVLGQDGSTPIPVKTPDGRELILWTFGDTLLGDWKGQVATTATLNFTDAADIKSMPPNTAAWSQSVSTDGPSALEFTFFGEAGKPSQPIPYIAGEDPFIKRLWASGGAQIKDYVYVYYMDVTLEREKGPLAFRPEGTGLARAKIGADFPPKDLRFERISGFNLNGIIAGDGVVAKDGHLYLAARKARQGDLNFNALCFLRAPARKADKAGEYEYLLPSGRWGKGQPAIFFDDVGGEVSLSWDAGRAEYSVFYMSSREQSIKFLAFKDFKALTKKTPTSRDVYAPPAREGALLYSAKEILRDERNVYVIYMDPAIYQPILVSISRSNLYP